VSHGLSLLRSIIDAQARAEFRHVHANLFTPTELPAFEFVGRFYRQYGVFPSPQACLEAGFILPQVDNPVGYYMERITTRATYNAIVQEQPNLAAAMQGRNMAEAVAILHRTIRSVGAFQTQQDVATLHEVATAVMEDYEHAHRHPGMQGLTLAWGPLDEITGGVEPGDVVTFAARPGMGKSWLLLYMAYRAWLLGNSILFVSMEMTAKQIARRILSLHAGVIPDAIRQGRLSDWGRNLVYQQLESMLTGAPFHILSGSFDKSVPLVDAAIQEFSPTGVYIDASYLMDPAEKNGQFKANEIASSVVKEVKQMAMSRERGIVQTVQFNREAEKSKSRGTAHLTGTDALGQITTIGVGIKEGTAPNETSSRILNVFKNREGEDQYSFGIDFLFRPPSFGHRPSGTAAASEEDHETLETAGGI
jgi:replicative DNA helicase